MHPKAANAALSHCAMHRASVVKEIRWYVGPKGAIGVEDGFQALCVGEEVEDISIRVGTARSA